MPDPEPHDRRPTSAWDEIDPVPQLGEQGPDARPRSLPFLHLLPNLVTILGLSAGLSSIRFAFEEDFELAALLIIFAAVIDGLDGLLARRLKVASSFGAELDSLSDFVNFGVAPALLVFFFALTDAPGFGWIFALVFAICCCLRLARFNVNRNLPPPPGRAHFTGVPAPAGALLAMLPLYLTLSGILDLRGAAITVALYLGLVGILMVSRIPTLSPKGLRISRNHVPYLLVATGVIVGLVLTRFWLLMVILVIAYAAAVVHGLVTARRRPTF